MPGYFLYRDRICVAVVPMCQHPKLSRKTACSDWAGQVMDCKQIEQRLTEQLQLTEVYVTAEGSHYAVTAVGECFDGVSRVKQQQLVYGPLMAEIADGSIHAVSIKAFTPTQWRREKLLNPPVVSN